jgi:hypothetical protein
MNTRIKISSGGVVISSSNEIYDKFPKYETVITQRADQDFNFEPARNEDVPYKQIIICKSHRRPGTVRNSAWPVGISQLFISLCFPIFTIFFDFDYVLLGQERTPNSSSKWILSIAIIWNIIHFIIVPVMLYGIESTKPKLIIPNIILVVSHFSLIRSDLLYLLSIKLFLGCFTPYESGDIHCSYVQSSYNIQWRNEKDQRSCNEQ